MLYMEQTFISQ